MPDPQAFANNHRNVFVGIGRTVRVFDQESGKHCNDFQLESQVTYLSVYQEKLIIGCQSGPPALLDLKHSTIHRLEIASQLDQQAKLGLDIMQVAPATYVRFMDKLVQSADNRHRIYDLSTMQHVHSFFYSGTVAGHLFNGCLAFILKSQSNANEGGKRYTFSLNTLSLGEELQTTPAIAFVEDKKSVSPVVLEEKKAIAAPDLLPIAHALPAPPPAAPSLLSQLFSCVSDACTQFFNWLCSCFRF